MPSLKEVRNRIVSVNSTQQITKAMKMVAAAKLRRAQDQALKIRPYANKLNGILQNISASLENVNENAYAVERDVNRLLVVVITSDRGLAGAFNANVIKGANALIEEKYASLPKTSIDYLCLGKKGCEFYQRRGENVLDQHMNIFHHLNFDSVKTIAEEVMNQFVSGKYDRVEVVYNEFKNVATQIVRQKQFLPIESIESSNSSSNTDYIFEPSKENIILDLIPKSLKIQFYKFLLESNASEHGARMSAMDKATENAKELLKDLKLTYNRSRQAAITKEILEIVGGSEALNG